MAHDASQAPFAKNGNDRGHIWGRGSNGEVNDFALEVDPHNGPRCARCGYSYCIHCDEGPDEDCPGRDAFRMNDREKARSYIGAMVRMLGGMVTWMDGEDG